MIKEFKVNLPEQFHKSAAELIHMGFIVTSYLIDADEENIVDVNGDNVSIYKVFDLKESMTLLSYIMQLDSQKGVMYKHEVSYTCIL